MPLVKSRIKDLSPLVRVYKCGPTKKETPEQIDYVSWLKINHPILRAAVFHVPNEGNHTKGYRSTQSKMGLSPGIPDLLFWCLPFVIEMKAANGSLKEEQKLRLNEAAEDGQFVCLCYGAEAAKEATADFLEWYRESK